MRTTLTYENFDVLLEPGDEHTYWARVVGSPAGETGRLAFTQPFAAMELENFLLRIGRPRRVGVVRSAAAAETAAIKTFGERLYRALFRDDLRVSLERSLSETAIRGAGLRLRLRLADTPELAELPWEFLYDQARNRFMCLSDRTPLVRFLEVADPPRPLPVSPPLRVLVMISSPRDASFAELDVEQEWSKLHGVLSGLEQAGIVQLERLETATLSALRQRLRRDDWHVLHFIGHGGFDPHAQDGVLVLEDQVGGSRRVTAQALGVLLHNHDPLRLVVLNACEGARANPTDPFAGTAQTLIQQGIPAVVAMQFEITDLAAIAFTSELYAAVADGYPLDAALSQARQAIYTDVSEIEWATPVLYLRAPDGHIFDIATTHSRASPLSADAAAPASTEEAAATTAPAHRQPRPKPAPTKPTTAVGDTESATAPGDAPAATDRSSTPVRKFEHPSRLGLAVTTVVFSPEGRRLATGSHDGTARIWEVASGQQLHTLIHDNMVRAVAFSPDSRWLATASYRTVRIWDVTSGHRVRALTHRAEVSAVAFSPDGRWLATGGNAETVRIWDVTSGQQLHTLMLAPGHGVSAMAFSPNGRWLATGSKDKTARIWDVTSGQPAHTLAHSYLVGAVAFSPDGRRLATSSNEKVVRIWDVATGEPVHILIHRGEASAVAFSLDGRWLATGSRDKAARIWDLTSGQQAHTLTHDNWVEAVAFSPDGRWLATGTYGNRAVLWTLTMPSHQ